MYNPTVFTNLFKVLRVSHHTSLHIVPHVKKKIESSIPSCELDF